jgi:hypothetical protein
MPWKDHLNDKELQIVADPHGRPHHIGHDRLAHLLEQALKYYIIRQNPKNENAIHATWHLVTDEKHPFNGLYLEAHHHIRSAIAAIDARAGHHVEHASDFLDRIAEELATKVRDYFHGGEAR